MKKKLRKILFLVLLTIFVVSGIMTVSKLAQYRTADKEIQEIQDLGITASPSKTDSDSSKHSIQTPEECLAALRSIDYTSLKGKNSDIIGWICIPGTNINYPILQTDDNNYYLNHTWKKTKNSSGSIYMDYRNTPDFNSFNTLLYGHRMNNTTMFGCLKHYENADYLKVHPNVYIGTPDSIYTFEIFAALEPATTDLTYAFRWSTAEERQAFLNFSLNHAAYNTNIVPSEKDKILTLSTCTGNGHETRWVVQARLVSCVAIH